MAQVQIVVALPLSPDLKEKIEAVDTKIHVTLLPHMQRYLYRNGRGLPMFYHELPPIELSAEEEAKEREQLEATLAQAEVLLSQSTIPNDLLERAPRLRWVQISSAGIDRLGDNPTLTSDVMVTTSSGIHAVPIAEYILAYMLYFTKSVPQAIENKGEHLWHAFLGQELYGGTVGIVGLGAIGTETARLAKAFNMRVIAIKRSAKKGERSPVADEVLPPSKLPYLLAESDYVVLTLPATEETRNLISEAELQTMKPTAYLINIARGTIVDTDALLRALLEGWIAGAALDVTAPEPLPPQHELWTLPNIIITPHISPATDRYVPRLVDLFCMSLRRYLDGQPPVNIYDPVKGY